MAIYIIKSGNQEWSFTSSKIREIFPILLQPLNCQRVYGAFSHDLRNYCKGPSIKDVRTRRSLSSADIFFGQGRSSSGAVVHTFWCKKFGFFETTVWCVRMEKGEEGIKPVRTRWEGVNISRFCADVLHGPPNIYLIVYPNSDSFFVFYNFQFISYSL